MQLTHGRTRLELHPLQSTGGRSLLLLHELGGAASQWNHADLEAWSGPIHALDFSGHGASEHLLGGGYVPESFLGDADHALAAIEHLGPCAVVGAGIGGYIAMLLAASRPKWVCAAMILPGRGLSGGGLLPRWHERKINNLNEWNAAIAQRSAHYLPGTDAMVSECEADIRNEAYVGEFAEAVRDLRLSEAVEQKDDLPPWWHLATGANHSQIVSAHLRQSLAELCRDCNQENAA